MRSRLAAPLAVGLAALLLAVVLFPARGEAGMPPLSPSWCTKNPDGSGYCYGTMKGFRETPDPSGYASIQVSSSSAAPWGWRFFQARFGGAYYSCSKFTQDWTWNALALLQGYFFVTWDAGGTCTDLVIYNASYYQ